MGEQKRGKRHDYIQVLEYIPRDQPILLRAVEGKARAAAGPHT